MFDRIDDWADRFRWLVWLVFRSVNGWLVSAWQNMFKFDTIYWLQMWNNDDYRSSQIESKWYMFVYLWLTDWLNYIHMDIWCDKLRSFILRFFLNLVFYFIYLFFYEKELVLCLLADQFCIKLSAKKINKMIFEMFTL